MANIKKIYQYPLLEKREQHITGAANKLIKDNLGIDVKENPEIQIDESLVREIKLNATKKNKYIIGKKNNEIEEKI